MEDIIKSIEGLVYLHREIRDLVKQAIHSIDSNNIKENSILDRKINLKTQEGAVKTQEFHNAMKAKGYDSFAKVLVDIHDASLRNKVSDMITEIKLIGKETILDLELHKSLAKIGKDTSAAQAKALAQVVDFKV